MSKENPQIKEKKTINWMMDLIVASIILVLVIGLQVNGYYNRVYYYVENCDEGVITVAQTNEVEWNRMKGALEERNKQGGIGKWNQKNLSQDWQIS